jgi:hypothetical protein
LDFFPILAFPAGTALLAEVVRAGSGSSDDAAKTLSIAAATAAMGAMPSTQRRMPWLR